MSPNQTDLAFSVVSDGDCLRSWPVIKKELRRLNCNMGSGESGGV